MDNPELWLYCQSCEAVMQAIDGYFEGDSHSCDNSVAKTGKPPKLLRLTAQRTRLEIESCRDEVAAINERVAMLLTYERIVRKNTPTTGSRTTLPRPSL